MKINLPHVTARKNADGSFRYYFRRRGVETTRLRGEPLSPEFMADYHRMLAVNIAQRQGQTRCYGTLGWLCDAYMESPEFSALAPSTQRDRARIMASINAEPIDPAFPERFGQERAVNITAKHITVLRNRKRAFPNAANERLKVLSQVFTYGMSAEIIEANPVALVKKLKITTQGHGTATDDDLARYLAFHKSGNARLAMRLLMAFGMRVGDLRHMGRKNIAGRTLVFQTGKSKYTSRLTCSLPIPDDLYADLMAVPHLVFLINEHGKPFASDKSISARVAKWFRQAGLDHITAHSVRKWLATQKAESGWSEYELMAWFGWNDPKEARPYVQKANRAKLAARDSERTTV